MVVKGDHNSYLISISWLCHFCVSLCSSSEAFLPTEKSAFEGYRSIFEPLILSKVRLVIIHPACRFLYVSINILSVLKMKLTFFSDNSSSFSVFGDL